MTATLTQTRVTIDLEAGCEHQSCIDLTGRIYEQLNTPHYSRSASVMAVPETLQEWRDQHRTARKRADRAARLGYRFDTIDRSQHNDDIYTINTSLERRQGRPMSDGYLHRHNYGALPHYPCDRHRVNTYGILDSQALRAYLTLYRLGDLAMVSMILGHGEHLDAGIMFALFQGVVEDQAGQCGSFFYNKHDSGRADGLQWFKERLGFAATDIEWVL